MLGFCMTMVVILGYIRWRLEREISILQRALMLMAHDLVDRGEVEDDELDATVLGVCRDYVAIARELYADAKPK